MKRFPFFVVACFCALLFSACGSGVSSQQKGSSGKTLELLLVADKDVYYGDTKVFIDSILRRPQVGLPQDEPIFDVVNIPTSSFKNTEMFRVHRNVVICDVNPGNPDKVYRYSDKWAAPQIVFEFAAKDLASLQTLLSKYESTLLHDIYQTEHRRMEKVFKASENLDIRDAMKKQLGVSMVFSSEFALATPNNASEDFMWVRKETKDFGIGVLVQALPYTDKSMFETSFILNALDTMMRRHVPCSIPDSYMGTERRLDAVSQVVDFEGSSYCVETRGCWRAFGDFMGGPYVSYALLSPDKKQIFLLTGYVYYPSGRLKSVTKRDLLMQVEGICHSLVFY